MLVPAELAVLMAAAVGEVARGLGHTQMLCRRRRMGMPFFYDSHRHMTRWHGRRI